jgi:uncharacterized RDD family membrane protein YckC
MASVPNSGPAAPPPPPVWDATPAGTAAQVAYGGFWIRVVAYIIDAILVSLVLGVVTAIFGVKYIDINDLDHYDPTANLLSILVFWLYFALMESSERGATVGKMAMGLRVVTNDGKRLSFMNATGRYFAKILSAIIFGIGFIMVAFTDRKRGLHDMIASTLVIKTR